MAWLTGYPRSKVRWNPEIDPYRCVQCGMCMNCGKKVFAWTEDGPVVARPENCVVGCSTCKNLMLAEVKEWVDLGHYRSVNLRVGQLNLESWMSIREAREHPLEVGMEVWCYIRPWSLCLLESVK